MTRFAIRRLHLFSAFQFGCLAGLIATILPAFLLALLIGNAAEALSGWLSTWAILELPGLLPDLNLLQLLNLTDLQATLQGLVNLGWLLTLGLTVLLVIAGGTWFAVAAVLFALLYNAVARVSGGLIVSGSALSPAGAKTAVATGSAWLASRQNAAHRWPLATVSTTFGSASGNTHVINGLDARQAEIRAEAGRYLLVDLSGGTTRVNGQPAGPGVWLAPGDVVRLGPYDFIFRTGSPGEPA